MSVPSLLPSEQNAASRVPRKSHLKPILITILCGVLFGAGSCVGFLNTLNFNGPARPLNLYFAVGFFIGVAAVLVGAIWALVAPIRFLFGGAQR